MKILMLVNWKVNYSSDIPNNLQPPDYYTKKEPYWFFKYFDNIPDIDVVDITSFSLLEKIEKNFLKFYCWQTIRILPKLKEYDLVVSHGMQSGILLSLWRLFFNKKTKHIVFDIGSFNSASESGLALRLMQFASKSIDCLIYHTKKQIEYYQKYFPHLVNKSHYVMFGTDADFFRPTNDEHIENYIVCVGYIKRDWKTLINAYSRLDTDVKLKLIGHVDDTYNKVEGIIQRERVSIEELQNEISKAKFCVLPLSYYNYSYGQMTLLQQMSLKKCVVVSNVPSVIDYIKDGVNGILYEHENAEDLYHKLSILIKNQEQCNMIGTNARNFIQNECNEKIMSKKIERIIIDINKKV